MSCLEGLICNLEVTVEEIDGTKTLVTLSPVFNLSISTELGKDRDETLKLHQACWRERMKGVIQGLGSEKAFLKFVLKDLEWGETFTYSHILDKFVHRVKGSKKTEIIKDFKNFAKSEYNNILTDMGVLD